jgi:hypothetical protein
MDPAYPEFRRRLDAVLRLRDPQALRQFLVAEGQWQADAATDPERAMWMMIATSPALGEFHQEAVRWLADHGYTEEARMLAGKASGDEASHRTAQEWRGSPGRHGGRRQGHRPRRGHGPGPGGHRSGSGRPGAERRQGGR